MIDWWRIAAYGAIVVAYTSVVGGWFYMKGLERLWDYQAKQAQQAVKIVVKQGEVTERIVTEYVQVAGKTEFVTNYVDREVEVYVETNPAGLCLDARWGELHDAAAANTIPDAAGEAHGERRAPTAAQALEAVTGNYSACHRTADKLDWLQEWVRGQKAVTASP